MSTKRKASKSGKTRSKKSMSVSSKGVFVRKNRAEYPNNAWVVFTKEGDRMKSPRLYDASLERDAVRNAYRRELGVAIQDTRSRRVVNMN